MPAPPTQDDIGDYLVDSFLNVLFANCGPCHDSAAPLTGSGGIRFFDDVERLVEAGLLIPLNSAESPIIRVSVQGSMPPPGSGLQLMTEADIGTLVQYIDNPRYWPNVAPATTDAGTTSPPSDAGVDGG
jgi:hypothetical protein